MSWNSLLLALLLFAIHLGDRPAAARANEHFAGPVCALLQSCTESAAMNEQSEPDADFDVGQPVGLAPQAHSSIVSPCVHPCPRHRAFSPRMTPVRMFERPPRASTLA